MAINIENFISRINDGNIAKPSLFQVEIVRKGIVVSEAELNLTFRCVNFTLPGRTLATTEFRYATDPVRQAAYAASYPDVSMNFIMSEDEREKIYFEEWQDDIIGNHRRNDIQLDPFRHSVGFYNDYVGNVKVKRLNEKGDIVRRTTLVEAYPSVIGDINLDWGEDGYILLPVTFTYRNYQQEDFNRDGST